MVGLGNPGAKYVGTRHNVGAECVEVLARELSTTLRSSRSSALVGSARIGARRVTLAVPTTYMNESGRAVRALMGPSDVDSIGDVVIVHDELDLEPGRVKIKVGGGLAGHNGLRSIESHVHTRDFVRVRIGVGKPEASHRGARHVLSTVTGELREILDIAIGTAADAVKAIATDGPDAAMGTYNATPPEQTDTAGNTPGA